MDGSDERHGRRLTRVLWGVGVALMACLMVGLCLWNAKQQWEIADLGRKVWLLRVLSPGRTRGEIVREMGAPHMETAFQDNAGKGHRLMVYPSSGRFPEWSEDIKLLMGADGRLEAVFFTDNADERRLLDDRTDAWRER